jgi:hypothetical protein
MHNTHTTTQSLIHLRKPSLLSLTWASEHYELASVRSILTNEGFRRYSTYWTSDILTSSRILYYNRRVLNDINMKQKYPISIIKKPSLLLNRKRHL